MTALPALGKFSSPAPPYTAGDAKTDLDALLAVVSELPGSAAPTELTIASGSITPTQAVHVVDTEADATSDDLDRLVVPAGAPQLVLLAPAVSGRWFRVRSHQTGAGQILLATASGSSGPGSTFRTGSLRAWLLLRLVGTDWYEVNRSYGGQAAVWPDDAGNEVQRFYSFRPDGRLVQMGRTQTSDTADTTVPLPVAYASTNYRLDRATVPGSALSGSPPVRLLTTWNKQAGSFDLAAYTLAGARSSVAVDWRTEGDAP